MSNLNTNDSNHHGSQGKGKANRLIDTKSPYLLQHAYNPVEWYPWCDEAFDKAKSENKPIFLSIGYSTCHWCHVMAHESFEDNEVAEVLNKDYISIKVDREERPDIDAVYMAACQVMTGGGGWPLTVLMTPEQKPFFAGTYFPKHSRLRMPGLIDVLQRMSNTWKKQQHELLSAADTMTEYLRGNAGGPTTDLGLEEKDPKEMINRAIELFCTTFDSKNGGFGREPKFPSPHNLILLMRHYKREENEEALEVAEKTLQQMYRGGIFDHIGYGFARYSTDQKWLAPHFEKMLYDNALLIMAYVEAYEITQNPVYRSAAEKTITYVSREMTDESGGFYSAQDADSEGEEGKFYVFKPHEIENVLGREDAELFCQHYDITDGGNFEGKNIPNLLKNTGWEKTDARIDQMIFKMYEYRAGRMSLHKDDKILTSWNALMIAALAKAYRILKDEQYLVMAERALCFIETHMTNTQGRLLARYRKGEAGILAYLDDYAFLIFAMLEMLEATGKEEYQQRAEVLCAEMVKLFWDEKNGGFFLYGSDATGLIARPKELYDGAMPSGNSVAAWNLVRLSHLAPGDAKMSERAYRQLRLFSRAVEQYPAGYSFFLSALMEQAYAGQEQITYACGPQGCSVR